MAKQFINLAIGDRGGAKARVRLDGRFYALEAIWIEGEQFWALTLYDATGVALVGGLVCRHAEDVLEPFNTIEFPGDGIGKLVVWDTTRNQADPGRDDLKRGAAVRLVYIPAADVTT